LHNCLKYPVRHWPGSEWNSTFRHFTPGAIRFRMDRRTVDQRAQFRDVADTPIKSAPGVKAIAGGP
jgi:hypothetical protein